MTNEWIRWMGEWERQGGQIRECTIRWLRQHPLVLGLPWKSTIKRSEKSNAIDVLCSGVLGKEVRRDMNTVCIITGATGTMARVLHTTCHSIRSSKYMYSSEYNHYRKKGRRGWPNNPGWWWVRMHSCHSEITLTVLNRYRLYSVHTLHSSVFDSSRIPVVQYAMQRSSMHVMNMVLHSFTLVCVCSIIDCILLYCLHIFIYLYSIRILICRLSAET